MDQVASKPPNPRTNSISDFSLEGTGQENLANHECNYSDCRACYNELSKLQLTMSVCYSNWMRMHLSLSDPFPICDFPEH